MDALDPVVTSSVATIIEQIQALSGAFSAGIWTGIAAAAALVALAGATLNPIVRIRSIAWLPEVLMLLGWSVGAFAAAAAAEAGGGWAAVVGVVAAGARALWSQWDRLRRTWDSLVDDWRARS